MTSSRICSCSRQKMILKPVLRVFAAVTLILAADWQCATALPNGAPLAACGDMIQRHAGSSPVDCGPDCPFQLTLIAVDGVPVAAGDPLEYTCGAQHTIRLESTDPAQTFRGFAIQSRESTSMFDLDASLLGQFVNPLPGNDWQLWDCQQPSATHTSRSDKTSVDLTWQGPELPSGNITFWFSITRRFSNFHTQIRGPEFVPGPQCQSSTATTVSTDAPFTGPENFIPFGPGNSVQLPTGSNVFSAEILLETDFVFFGRKQTSLYVNTNGVMSFGSPYSDFGEEAFPIVSPPLIAPFLHNISTINGGNVYYELTSDHDFIAGIVAGAPQLDPDDNLPDYTPTLLFIATWDRVAPFSDSSSNRNTFQAILATDGETSTVSFVYGDIQWGEGAEIGFNAGDGVGFLSVPSARTSATVDIEFQTNVNVTGLFIYRVDDLETIIPTEAPTQPPAGLPLEDFVPFGLEEGDFEVRTTDGGASPVVRLSTEFVFFGRKETDVYVNENGLLSFNDTFTLFGPRRFPFTSPPLIAPFYHDVNIERGGNIFYRQTSDPDFIASVIANASTLSLDDDLLDFKPTLLFIATWYRVAQFSEFEPNRNTFQVVLATDGETSAVSFLYSDIQWGEGAEIGFNGGDRASFFTVPLSVPSTDIDTQSNVGVPGLFIYRVDVCFEGDLRVMDAFVDVDFDTVPGNFLTVNVLTFEICSDGVFGRVCNVDCGDEDAAIVCNTRGYIAPRFFARADSSPRFDGNVSLNIVAQDVTCNNTMGINFTSCSWNTNISSECRQSDRVANARCTELPTRCTEGVIQSNLIFDSYELNGDVFTIIEGMFEVCIDGAIGSVCDIGWTDTDAAVVCRNIRNLEPPQYVAEALFGFELGRSQQFAGQNFMCNGSESSLSDCSPRRNVSSECNNGPHAAGYRCREVPLPCNEGEVRLANQSFGGGRTISTGASTQFFSGYINISGRVEICLNDVFGAVCDSGWDEVDSQVVCNMLGYNAPFYRAVPLFGQYSNYRGPINYQDVQCSGNESSLSFCNRSLISDPSCTNTSRIAGVQCIEELVECFDSDTSLNYRLFNSRRAFYSNGSSLLSARVDVCFNGTFGSICDVNWDVEDAIALCRNEFGGQFVATAVGESQFGISAAGIVLEDIRCDGREDGLFSCVTSELGLITDPQCSDPGRAAGVVCFSTCFAGTTRIIDGLSLYEGRVEVCSNNQWGTICDVGWDNLDASVVCRGNSLFEGVAVPGGVFPPGPGPIVASGVTCTGSEYFVTECANDTIIRSECTHDRDAGVRCTPGIIIMEIVDESEPILGLNYTIQCNAFSFPWNVSHVSYQWNNGSLASTSTRNISLLNATYDNSRLTFIFNSSIHFTPLTLEDVGVYTCGLTLNLTLLHDLMNTSLATISNTTSFTISTIVPGPHYIAVDSSPSQAGENFTASCLINVTAGLDLTPDVINFQWLDSNGMPISNTPDGRIRVDPVRQINEELFVRDVVITPLLLDDAGNYTCEAAIQGPFITSESIDLDVTLVVFAGQPFSIECSISLPSPLAPQRVECEAFNGEADMVFCVYDDTSSENCTLSFDIDVTRFDPGSHTLSVVAFATDGRFSSTQEPIVFVVPEPLLPVPELLCFPAQDARLILLTCQSIPDPVHNGTCAVDGAVPESCDLSQIEIDQFSFSPGIHMFTINFVNVRGVSGQISFNFTGFIRPRVDIQITPAAGSVGEGFENSFFVQVFGFSYDAIPIQVMPLSYDQFNELGTGIELTELFNASRIPTDAATPGADFSARESTATFFAGDLILPNQDLVHVQTYLDGVRDDVEGYVVLFQVNENELDERDRGQINITGAIQLAVIVPGSTMFEIIIGDVELSQRPELLEVAIQPVENFTPVISVTDEQQTVIATDFASLIVDWSVWVRKSFSNPSNNSFVLVKTLIDQSGTITGPTIVLSMLELNDTLFIDPLNGFFQLYIPEYNPFSAAEDSDNGIYTLEGCKNRGTPSEICSSADITLFGIIIPFEISCRVDMRLFEIVVMCIPNLPVEAEYQCSYDNRASEDCDDFILINLLEFSVETHTLRIVGTDLRGFSDSFDLEFAGLSVDTLPPTRLSYYVSDSIDPTARPRTVFIPESGITDARSIVQIDGPVIRNITVRLVPLTYDEYEARFPSINLNDVFPSRPLPAERGDFNRSPLTLNFVDERQDRRVRFPHPVNDNETELSEGFLFLLEVDGRITDPLDLSRLQILNNIILVVIEDDDESIECSSNIADEVVTFTCTDIDTLPPEISDNLECSVDFGSPEPCLFPYQVALSQIAPGEHHLRVLSRVVGEPIPDEILGGTQFELPRLEVFFVNNTPILDVDRLYAEFETNRPGVLIECHLTHLDNSRVDCSDGVFERDGIPPGDYTLRVVARDPSRPRERRAVARNRIWVHGDDEFCVVVLQNRASIIDGNSVTFEFEGTGLTNGYRCILDRTEFVECSSPYTIENVPIGEHHFKIIPRGCGRNFRGHPQKFNIN